MQLPKAVLRHIGENAALRQITSALEWLTAEARRHCCAHRRYWAALTAVVLTVAALTLRHHHAAPAIPPASPQVSQDDTGQPQQLLDQQMNPSSHSHAGSWYNPFASTMPELLDRWTDYKRDAPDEPAGHTVRHVPSRHMHKQTVWYRSAIDNTTRLHPADTRGLQVSGMRLYGRSSAMSRQMQELLLSGMPTHCSDRCVAEAPGPCASLALPNDTCAAGQATVRRPRC